MPYQPRNNLKLTLAAAHAAGSGTATVAGLGELGTPSEADPVLLTGFRKGAPTVPLFNVPASAVAGNVLTLGAITWGTDTDLAAGDFLIATWTAEAVQELQSTIAAKADTADLADYYTAAQTDGLLAAKADTADLGTMAARDAADYATTAQTDAAIASALTPYITSAAVAAGYSPLGHTHAIADVAGLQTALDGKAADVAVVHNTGNESINGIKTFNGAVGIGGPIGFGGRVLDVRGGNLHLTGASTWTSFALTSPSGLGVGLFAGGVASYFQYQRDGQFAIRAVDRSVLDQDTFGPNTDIAFKVVASGEFGLGGIQSGTAGDYAAASLYGSAAGLIGIGTPAPSAQAHVKTGAATRPILTTEALASQTGAHWILRGRSSTADGRSQAVVDAAWQDATDASRKGRLSLKASDFAGDREGLSVWSDGTGARVALSAPATAPNDADLTGAQISFYLDETAGALKVRVKYADGTLRTGSLTLT